MRDNADEIMTKIKKAKTDPEPLPNESEGLKGRPEAQNLVSIYGALSGMSEDDVLKEFGGQGFGVFKPALADLATTKLAPMTDEMNRYMKDPAEIDAVLAKGAEQAHAIAQPIMQDIHRLIGFLGKSLG
jgi:tryptophanyl-tRNA synthetase